MKKLSVTMLALVGLVGGCYEEYHPDLTGAYLYELEARQRCEIRGLLDQLINADPNTLKLNDFLSIEIPLLGYEDLAGERDKLCKQWWVTINRMEKYQPDKARTILEGKIRLGFLKDDVLASWGKPGHINRTVGSWGVHEQWVYNSPYGPYLYFENGILTAWQN